VLRSRVRRVDDGQADDREEVAVMIMRGMTPWFAAASPRLRGMSGPADSPLRAQGELCPQSRIGGVPAVGSRIHADAAHLSFLGESSGNSGNQYGKNTHHPGFFDLKPPV
jgi:hypothetical protein